MNRQNLAACESFGLASGRSLEGLRLAAEPCLDNAIATYAFVNAAGDCLHLREFGHRFIVVDRWLSTAARLLAGVMREFRFIAVLARLQASPFLQVDHSERKADQENTH